MDGFVYGQRRPLPQGFDEFLAVADPAIVSIDLHQGISPIHQTARVRHPVRARLSKVRTVFTPLLVV
jgi:hypothetical protein